MRPAAAKLGCYIPLRQFSSSGARHAATTRRVYAVKGQQLTDAGFRARVTGGSQSSIPLHIQRPEEGAPHMPPMDRWFTYPAGDPAAADFSWQLRAADIYTNHINYELVLDETMQSSHPGNPLFQFAEWLSRRSEEGNSLRHLALAHQAADLRKVDLVRRTPFVEPGNKPYFHQFLSSLSLFSEALKYNLKTRQPRDRVGQLYIAQTPLEMLPPEMHADAHRPHLLDLLAIDVYNSSIWMGLQPTYTPFHNDPNDNLFCQVRGSKVVRLLPPERGNALFFQVKAEIAAQLKREGRISLFRPASPGVRGEEMMQWREREAFHKAVWSEQAPVGILEARLNPGDMLFIPRKWWHSVQSVGTRGALNVSMNWWFRWTQG
ncbi:cupin-like domain-containing protein [Lasiosphaeria hispida]|uniref:Cupin-like domain-containing protein n=1 Tax=Lasiosphaeria hispida TaxID=260671 RepID=A0AAJ0HEE3_9PEZI|nr:cupin-like domain-containing protein [Lasiosphaeria hispida]